MDKEQADRLIGAIEKLTEAIATCHSELFEGVSAIAGELNEIRKQGLTVRDND